MDFIRRLRSKSKGPKATRSIVAVNDKDDLETIETDPFVDPPQNQHDSPPQSTRKPSWRRRNTVHTNDEESHPPRTITPRTSSSKGRSRPLTGPSKIGPPPARSASRSRGRPLTGPSKIGPPPARSASRSRGRPLTGPSKIGPPPSRSASRSRGRPLTGPSRLGPPPSRSSSMTDDDEVDEEDGEGETPRRRKSRVKIPPRRSSSRARVEESYGKDEKPTYVFSSKPQPRGRTKTGAAARYRAATPRSHSLNRPETDDEEEKTASTPPEDSTKPSISIVPSNSQKPPAPKSPHPSKPGNPFASPPTTSPSLSRPTISLPQPSPTPGPPAPHTITATPIPGIGRHLRKSASTGSLSSSRSYRIWAYWWSFFAWAPLLWKLGLPRPKKDEGGRVVFLPRGSSLESGSAVMRKGLFGRGAVLPKSRSLPPEATTSRAHSLPIISVKQTTEFSYGRYRGTLGDPKSLSSSTPSTSTTTTRPSDSTLLRWPLGTRRRDKSGDRSVSRSPYRGDDTSPSASLLKNAAPMESNNLPVNGRVYAFGRYTDVEKEMTRGGLRSEEELGGTDRLMNHGRGDKSTRKIMKVGNHGIIPRDSSIRPPDTDSDSDSANDPASNPPNDGVGKVGAKPRGASRPSGRYPARTDSLSASSASPPRRRQSGGRWNRDGGVAHDQTDDEEPRGHGGGVAAYRRRPGTITLNIHAVAPRGSSMDREWDEDDVDCEDESEEDGGRRRRGRSLTVRALPPPESVVRGKEGAGLSWGGDAGKGGRDSTVTRRDGSLNGVKSVGQVSATYGRDSSTNSLKSVGRASTTIVRDKNRDTSETGKKPRRSATTKEGTSSNRNLPSSTTNDPWTKNHSTPSRGIDRNGWDAEPSVDLTARVSRDGVSRSRSGSRRRGRSVVRVMPVALSPEDGEEGGKRVSVLPVRREEGVGGLGAERRSRDGLTDHSTHIQPLTNSSTPHSTWSRPPQQGEKPSNSETRDETSTKLLTSSRPPPSTLPRSAQPPPTQSDYDIIQKPSDPPPPPKPTPQVGYTLPLTYVPRSKAPNPRHPSPRNRGAPFLTPPMSSSASPASSETWESGGKLRPPANAGGGRGMVGGRREGVGGVSVRPRGAAVEERERGVRDAATSPALGGEVGGGEGVTVFGGDVWPTATNSTSWPTALAGNPHNPVDHPTLTYFQPLPSTPPSTSSKPPPAPSTKRPGEHETTIRGGVLNAVSVPIGIESSKNAVTIAGGHGVVVTHPDVEEVKVVRREEGGKDLAGRKEAGRDGRTFPVYFNGLTIYGNMPMSASPFPLTPEPSSAEAEKGGGDLASEGSPAPAALQVMPSPVAVPLHVPRLPYTPPQLNLEPATPVAGNGVSVMEGVGRRVPFPRVSDGSDGESSERKVGGRMMGKKEVIDDKEIAKMTPVSDLVVALPTPTDPPLPHQAPPPFATLPKDNSTQKGYQSLRALQVNPPPGSPALSPASSEKALKNDSDVMPRVKENEKKEEGGKVKVGSASSSGSGSPVVGRVGSTGLGKAPFERSSVYKRALASLTPTSPSLSRPISPPKPDAQLKQKLSTSPPKSSTSSTPTRQSGSTTSKSPPTSDSAASKSPPSSKGSDSASLATIQEAPPTLVKAGSPEVPITRVKKGEGVVVSPGRDQFVSTGFEVVDMASKPDGDDFKVSPGVGVLSESRKDGIKVSPVDRPVLGADERMPQPSLPDQNSIADLTFVEAPQPGLLEVGQVQTLVTSDEEGAPRLSLPIWSDSNHEVVEPLNDDHQPLAFSVSERRGGDTAIALPIQSDVNEAVVGFPRFGVEPILNSAVDGGIPSEAVAVSIGDAQASSRPLELAKDNSGNLMMNSPAVDAADMPASDIIESRPSHRTPAPHSVPSDSLQAVSEMTIRASVQETSENAVLVTTPIKSSEQGKLPSDAA
ncbi:hypothetical protein HDU67_004838 [Dinochytrium kinnereticum]|nr:hypothetical protein HDU67_004838 [Dinochytrium kinnereticum]